MSDTNKKRLTLLRRKHWVIPLVVLVLLLVIQFFADVARAENSVEVPDAADAPAPALTEEEPGFFDRAKGWLSSKLGEGKEEVSKTYQKAVKDTAVALGSKVSDDTADDLEQQFKDQIGETETELIVDVAYDVKQIDCLTRALVFEAGGEPDFGKLWVLHVIDNRRELEYRGMKSYCDVIFDRYQFSFANFNPDRVPGYTDDLIESKRLAVQFYYEQPDDITDCSTHYLAPDTVDPMDVKWARQALEGNSDEDLEPKATIGGHMFFGPPSC